MKVTYWVFAVVITGFAVTVYFLLGDPQRTVPKIKLSHFESSEEIASSISKRISNEIKANKQYFAGFEPDKAEQIPILVALKNEIEGLNGPFQQIFVDHELQLPTETVNLFPNAQVVPIKENLDLLGERLALLEKEGKSYLVVTAAIYSNSFIKKNQIHQLEEKYKIKPLTLSVAYFPTTAEEEKLMLFPCSTDDHTGTTNWGCAVVNKARFAKRRINPKSEKPWIGLMDLTGENDYMLLVKKKL